MAKHSSWPGAAWRLAVFRQIRRTTEVPGAIAQADKPRNYAQTWVSRKSSLASRSPV